MTMQNMCDLQERILYRLPWKTGLLEYHVEIAKSILDGENITHDVVLDASVKCGTNYLNYGLVSLL